MLSDFLTHLKDYIHNNRARLAKIIFIIALIIGAALLIYGIVDNIQRARYEKKINELDQQFKDVEAKAQAHEQVANALKTAIAVRDVEIEHLTAQGKAADRVLVKTRTEYVTLKENYDETRNVPVVPMSCTDLCAELAALGYPCK